MSSSLIFFWLAIPVIYTLSGVLVPGTPEYPGDDDMMIDAAYDMAGSFPLTKNISTRDTDDKGDNDKKDKRKDKKKKKKKKYTFSYVYKYWANFFAADLYFAELCFRLLYGINDTFSADRKKNQRRHWRRHKLPILTGKPRFISAPMRKRTPLEKLHFAEFRRRRLPFYNSLCNAVTNDLTSAICGPLGMDEDSDSEVRWAVNWFFYLLTHMGIGHFFTHRGRWYFSVVCEKLWLFSTACVGIWTDKHVEYYDLKKFQDEMCKYMDSCEENRIKFMSNATGAIIATGAMIFQFSSWLSWFSAFAITMAGSPLFVQSRWLKDHLPDLLILDIWDVAKDRLAELGKTNLKDYQYQIWCTAIFVFMGESRLIQFTLSLFEFILAVLFVLRPDRIAEWSVLTIILLLPFSFCEALQYLVFFGEYLDVRDSDFKRVFYWAPKTQSSFAEEGDAAASFDNDRDLKASKKYTEHIAELEAGKMSSILWENPGGESEYEYAVDLPIIKKKGRRKKKKQQQNETTNPFSSSSSSSSQLDDAPDSFAASDNISIGNSNSNSSHTPSKRRPTTQQFGSSNGLYDPNRSESSESGPGSGSEDSSEDEDECSIEEADFDEDSDDNDDDDDDDDEEEDYYNDDSESDEK